MSPAPGIPVAMQELEPVCPLGIYIYVAYYDQSDCQRNEQEDAVCCRYLLAVSRPSCAV